jgi:ATP-binding cassette subfamily G (WHITE) protein 2
VYTPLTQADAGLEALGIYTDLIPANGTLGLVRTGVQDLGPGCIASGNAVLDFYGVSHTYGFYVGILFAYWAVVHLLTYAGLHRQSARLVPRA